MQWDPLSGRYGPELTMGTGTVRSVMSVSTAARGMLRRRADFNGHSVLFQKILKLRQNLQRNGNFVVTTERDYCECHFNVFEIRR